VSEAPGGFEQAVAALWAGFRPLVLARIDAIETYAVRRQAGGEADRGPALAAAHQLVGALGSYGYAAAGELAQAIERELDGAMPDPELLLPLVRDLRAAAEVRAP
jgi:HPt (histidine-containing phosphotransfer) domain-containing protein